VLRPDAPQQQRTAPVHYSVQRTHHQFTAAGARTSAFLGRGQQQHEACSGEAQAELCTHTRTHARTHELVDDVGDDDLNVLGVVVVHPDL